jgi:hypothetical protein
VPPPKPEPTDDRQPLDPYDGYVKPARPPIPAPIIVRPPAPAPVPATPMPRTENVTTYSPPQHSRPWVTPVVVIGTLAAVGLAVGLGVGLSTSSGGTSTSSNASLGTTTYP